MFRVQVLGSFGDVGATEWDALVGEASPFLEHTFLLGLEETGCATQATGWVPRPVVVRDAGGALVAAAPAWIKPHSMGEFVYDHAWADAAQRAGFPYFPKLVVAVPFTPVTGPRLLGRDDARSALLDGLRAAAERCHGLHVLFDTDTEAAWLAAQGAFERLQFQFHWKNDGYDTFDDWLSRFRSKTRNKLRRERKEAARLRIVSRTNPSAAELDALHRFYTHTCGQFGPWGHAYLSAPLFRRLGERWGHRLHAVLAYDGDVLVAGAFNVVKGDTLYGRYWGCDAQYRFLHFEVCYYQAVAYCIAHGLRTFEPGHGGGHKYRRGFEPTITRSNHLFADPRLHEPLERWTAEESAHVRDQAEALRALSPFRDE